MLSKLIFICLVNTLTIKIHPNIPFIYKHEDYVPDECKMDDPLALCGGESLTIVNPLKRSVVVELECHGGNIFNPEATEVKLEPLEVKKVNVELPSKMDSCILLDWRYSKK